MTPQIRQQITRIAEGGAIIFIQSGMDRFPLNVGELALLDDHRLFYFETFGETEFQGHVVEFDEARAPHALGVEFVRDGSFVAYLCPIAEADLPPDAEASALQVWKEWRGRRAEFAAFIQQTKEARS